MRPPASAEVADAAVRYIAGRQCRDGGFCFYRTAELEEPNLADTWFALSGLRWLGAPVPRADAVVRWLEGFDAQALHDEVLHHWVRSLQWLQPGWRPDAGTLARIAGLALPVPEDGLGLSRTLGVLLWRVSLQAAFGLTRPQPALVQALLDHRREGAWGEPVANLQDTAAALRVLALLGVREVHAQTRQFVDARQSAALGFDNTATARYSRVDILCAGVDACALLEVPLQHAHKVRAITLGAQRGDGAFADVPGALPDLQSHQSALRLLAALAQADARGVPAWLAP